MMKGKEWEEEELRDAMKMDRGGYTRADRADRGKESNGETYTL